MNKMPMNMARYLALSLTALKKILATYLTVGNCTICTTSKPSEKLVSLLSSIKVLKFILQLPEILQFMITLFLFSAAATSPSCFPALCICLSPSLILSKDSRFTSYFTYESRHPTTLFLLHFSSLILLSMEFLTYIC